MASKTHPGFEAAASTIARRTNPSTGRPYGKEAARAILASSSRAASAAAKRSNPRLKRV